MDKTRNREPSVVEYIPVEQLIQKPEFMRPDRLNQVGFIIQMQTTFMSFTI